jgi:hypothetical protein
VSAALRAYQSVAIGKVAPIAAAGTPRSARLMATRTSANRTGAVPSAYAHASAGNVAASASGRSSALIATTISRIAYLWSAVRVVFRVGSSVVSSRTMPAIDAPIARPPMNAARTVLAAATV